MSLFVEITWPLLITLGAYILISSTGPWPCSRHQHLLRRDGRCASNGAPFQHLLRLQPLLQLQGWIHGRKRPHRCQFQGWRQFQGCLLCQGPPGQYQQIRSLSPTAPNRGRTAHNLQGWPTRNPSQYGSDHERNGVASEQSLSAPSYS